MTCIAGLVHEGSVYLGGDSATSTRIAGSSVVIKANPKVFCVGPFVIGVAGQPRVGQLLHFAFMPPPQDLEDPDCYRYMVTSFVDAMRQTLKAGGLAERVNEHEHFESQLLVGYRGCLFQIGGTYSVTMAQDHFDAIGSGGEAARGALFASSGKDPLTRMRLALEAAEQFQTGVRCPFSVLRQDTHPIRPGVELEVCCEVEYSLEDQELHNNATPDSGASSSSAA